MSKPESLKKESVQATGIAGVLAQYFLHKPYENAQARS